jgi:hypothetical protein
MSVLVPIHLRMVGIPIRSVGGFRSIPPRINPVGYISRARRLTCLWGNEGSYLMISPMLRVEQGPTGRSTSCSFREVGNQFLDGKSYVFLLDREGIAMEVIISMIRLYLPVLGMK